MNRLKNNILNELNRNKFKTRKDNKTKNKINLTFIPSLAFMLLAPIIFVFLLDMFFNFNRDIYLSLFVFAMFCSFYNIYKTISELYKKPMETKIHHD